MKVNEWISRASRGFASRLWDDSRSFSGGVLPTRCREEEGTQKELGDREHNFQNL